MSTSTTIGKWVIESSNHQELVSLKKEIFHQGRYEIDCETDQPRIIDAGAHVGLATIFFKSRWPKAEITCIEPFPENIQHLKHNLWINRFDDVAVIEAALAGEEGERPFYFDQTDDSWYSTAGFCDGAWNNEQQSQSIQVKTIPLASIITQPVDILKLDIEGAETAVLSAAVSVLPQIHHIVMEFHPTPQNNWNNLMILMKKANFISAETIPPNYPTWLRHYHFINNKFSP